MNHKYFNLILLTVFLLIFHAKEESLAQTGDTQGASDPCIIKADGKYVVFSSGKGIPILVSADLKNWKLTGSVFLDVPQWAKIAVPGSSWIWAPDISFHDGFYWLYYAVSTIGSRRSVIGLAVNTTLDPTSSSCRWQDRGLVYETHETDDFNAIDPQYVENGQESWLAFGSYWGGIKMVSIDRKTGKPESGASLLSIAARPQAKAIEGVFIIKHGEYFYLFASHDFTGRGPDSTYKIVVGRSKSPTGPFFDKSSRSMLDDGGTPIVVNSARWRGPGHCAVLEDNGKSWLVYHALDANDHFELKLRIDEIRWSATGWPDVDTPAADTERRFSQRNQVQGRGSVVGLWEHRVDHGAASMIHLLPNGRINDRDGPATWSLVGDVLELKWPNGAAAGGAFIDRCTLNSGRTAYLGANQLNLPIYGRFVCSE